MHSIYNKLLTHIYDDNFGDFSLHASKSIIDTFKKENISKGLVVDLGCGSGTAACEFIKSNFQVLGIEQSEEFVKIAMKKAPQAVFINDSFFNVELPMNVATISTSESLNYAHENVDGIKLKNLFNKIYDALYPGGLFIFDMMAPHHISSNVILEEDSWTMFCNVFSSEDQLSLTRDFTIFSKNGETYLKSKELHKLNLYPIDYIKELLDEAGFESKLFNSYGNMKLASHEYGFLCKKR